MTKYLATVVSAIALIIAGSGSANAFGLLNLDLCGSNCCDTGCTDSCCDAAPCCDAAGACDGCDACVGCGNSSMSCDCLGRMKLLGCLKPSDHCFDDFISPMINFVHFEDPRTLTEVRPIYLYHNLPNRVGSLGLPGGAVQLYALQIRLALTERLSLIAVKDGYIIDNVRDGTLDDLLDDGWAAVTAGLKYNVLRDTRRGRLGSVGFTYEMPVGSRRTLQDVGDGEFHIFGTGGCRLCDGNAHWLAAFGARIPVDNDIQTTSIHWSNHFDVKLTRDSYFVSEFAWWHWTDSAKNGLPIGVGGQDLFNLPASNVTGNNLITKNFGLKYKPSAHSELGIAYEFPLTGRDDIIKDRIQLEMILRM